jgi:hypothetical protein
VDEGNETCDMNGEDIILHLLLGDTSLIWNSRNFGEYLGYSSVFWDICPLSLFLTTKPLDGTISVGSIN